MKKSKRRGHISHALLFSGGMAVAFVIGKAGVVEHLVELSSSFILLGAFVAGFFFTSLLTVAPAGVMLYEILHHTGTPIALVAVVGGLGAMCGDLVLLKFLKSNLTDDLAAFVRAHTGNHFKRMWRFRWFSWAMMAAGALIIASPFPDELGIAMMGVGDVKARVFMPLTFAMNAGAIAIIGLFA